MGLDPKAVACEQLQWATAVSKAQFHPLAKFGSMERYRFRHRVIFSARLFAYRWYGAVIRCSIPLYFVHCCSLLLQNVGLFPERITLVSLTLSSIKMAVLVPFLFTCFRGCNTRAFVTGYQERLGSGTSSPLFFRSPISNKLP